MTATVPTAAPAVKPKTEPRRRLSLDVPVALYDRLAFEADCLNISVSAYVRSALADYVRD